MTTLRAIQKVRSMRKALCACTLLFAFAWQLPSCASALAQGLTVDLGANKFDLAQQYLGVASGGKGQEDIRETETAMAEKAIEDARRSGLKFFRVAITGFAPSYPGDKNDLRLWLDNPQLYWSYMDKMMTDLHQSGIMLVPTFTFNVLQFPTITGETLSDLIDNPNSQSSALLERYIRSFIARYKNSQTILFYEVANELNLRADINEVAFCLKRFPEPRCETVSNVKSEEIVSFTGRIYHLIKSLDPDKLVSSGFSLPRVSAEHLRLHPALPPGKGDWQEDSISDLFTNIQYMDRYSDLVSVHLYPANVAGRNLSRFLPALCQIAAKLGKPLFIGEFGEPHAGLSQASSFYQRMFTLIKKYKVPFSAFWDWEVYPSKDVPKLAILDVPFNISPAATPEIVNAIKMFDQKPLH